jgi:hypothetical protein
MGTTSLFCLIDTGDKAILRQAQAKECSFMRIALFCVLSAYCLVLSGGCSWVGHTAGKAQAKIERKADSLEQGYHKGYEEEKAKTESQ